MLKAKGLSSCAMILAAGLGTRMRPLTDQTPKPLIKLNGMPLIDHVISRLLQAGVETIAVNLHYHADQLEAHLKQCQQPRIIFSDERAKILDSGGGAKKMLPHIGGKPFLLANSDTLWMENAADNVARLVEAWDEKRMDILLLLASTATAIGYDGKGDFMCAPDGKLTRRHEHDVAPFAYAGVAIFKPELFNDTPDTPFSLNLLFNRAIEREKLYGLRLDGVWMHVGTIDALRKAENLIAGRT
jgi:MurNAc alpha-1-phosphate uridylyltransferase